MPFIYILCNKTSHDKNVFFQKIIQCCQLNNSTVSKFREFTFNFFFSANRTLLVESQCLQNGSWTPVDFTCVPNEDRTSVQTSQNGGFFLSSSNVHTALSMPVLLSIVVIVTVIVGIALSLVVFLVRRW